MKYNKKNKQLGIIILALAVLFLSIAYVSAFSIGFSSAINIEPGQSVEKGFSIINKGTDAEDLTVEVVVEEGSQYITLPEGTQYQIPKGELKPVPATFSVPSSAQPGDKYTVKMSFNSIEGGTIGGGSLEFKVGHSLSFDINVMEKVPTTSSGEEQPTPAPEGSSLWWILGIVVIVVVIVVVVLLVKGRKAEAVKQPMK